MRNGLIIQYSISKRELRTVFLLFIKKKAEGIDATLMENEL